MNADKLRAQLERNEKYIAYLMDDTPVRSFDRHTIPMNAGFYFALGAPDGPAVLLHARNKETLDTLESLLSGEASISDMKKMVERLQAYAATGLDPETMKAHPVTAALADLRVIATRPEPNALWREMPDRKGDSPRKHLSLELIIQQDQNFLRQFSLTESLLFWTGTWTDEETGVKHRAYSSPVGAYEITEDTQGRFRVYEHPVSRKLEDRYAMIIKSNGQEVLSEAEDGAYATLPLARHAMCRASEARNLRNFHIAEPYLNTPASLRSRLRQSWVSWWYDVSLVGKFASGGRAVLRISAFGVEAVSLGGFILGKILHVSGNYLGRFEKKGALSSEFNRKAGEITPDAEKVFDAQNLNARKSLREYLRLLDFSVPQTLVIRAEEAVPFWREAMYWAKRKLSDFGGESSMRGRDIIDPRIVQGNVGVLDLLKQKIIPESGDFSALEEQEPGGIRVFQALKALRNPASLRLDGVLIPHESGEAFEKTVLQIQNGGLVREMCLDEKRTVYARLVDPAHEENLSGFGDANDVIPQWRDYRNVLKITFEGYEDNKLPVFRATEITNEERKRELAKFTGNDEWLSGLASLDPVGPEPAPAGEAAHPEPPEPTDPA